MTAIRTISMYLCVAKHIFFLIHHLQNTRSPYNCQLKQVKQSYVSEDGDSGHLMIGNFHSGIFLVFYFHEPIMNLEISTKYHFATDMSI